MTEQELKKIVHGYLVEGLPLPEIQERLESDHQYKIKFMDLRILAADLEDIDWSQFDPTPKAVPQDTEEASADVPPAPTSVFSKTEVSVSKIVRPGCAMSGTVSFASGGTAEWIIDHQGRPGLENLKGPQPSEEDVRDFMVQLQSILSGGAR